MLQPIKALKLYFGHLIELLNHSIGPVWNCKVSGYMPGYSCLQWVQRSSAFLDASQTRLIRLHTFSMILTSGDCAGQVSTRSTWLFNITDFGDSKCFFSMLAPLRK